MRHWARALAVTSFLGCGAPTPPTAPATPPLPPAPRASVAAFAIVLGSRTIVVSVDPAREVLEADGIWFLDETGPQPTVVWLGEDPWDAPVCACACASACFQPREVIPATGALVPLAQPCACAVGPQSEACPPDPEAGEPDEDDCGTGAGEALGALTGGVLTSVSWAQEGCEGVNYYDGSSDEQVLVRRAHGFEAPAGAERTCSPEEVFLDSLARTAGLTDPQCRFDGSDWVASDGGEEGDCDECGRRAEQVLARVRRGRVLLLSGRVDGPGGGALEESSWPARPDECAPMDPCGDPGPFAALDGDGPSEWWVASDGSAALGLEARAASVYAPGREERASTRATSIEQVSFGDDEGILAVFFHADASALVDAIERSGRLRAERPRATGDACAEDADCAVTHGCGAFCRAETCRAASDAECDQHFDQPGARCVERAVVRVPLSPADLAVTGPRAASTLGDRCVAHLRAGDHDLAEAACARALELTESASTQGALLYNLGRIAEARGERARARTYYARSLAVRPGNAIVEGALDVLEDDERQE